MPDTIDMTEFDDIIAALREERPDIGPGFARSLDQRAADGFAKPPWHVRLPSFRWLGVPAAGLAALFVVAAVVSGGGTGSDSGSSGGGGSVASSGAAQSATEPSTGSAAPEILRDSTASAGVPAPAVRGRVQEESAALTLVAPAKEVGDVGDRILGVADQVGGFVVSSSVRATDGESGGGDFRLRVPVDRLDDALARLSRLAHVSERTQGSQDITAERNVARERYREAVAERRSLLIRLGKATTDNEVASIKARLDDVNAAIASFKTSLRQVVRRTQFAAVAVTLAAKPKRDTVGPADDGKWTPADAIRDAGRVLEVAAGVVVIVGSVLLPLALLALLALGGQRLAGRRGRDRMLETV